MRKVLVCMAIAAVFGITALGAPAAEGGIISHVPVTVEQISDSSLQSALVGYSPTYNSLTHEEKIRNYTTVYQSLHGTMPPLTADDKRLMGQSGTEAATTTYTYSTDGTPVYSYEPAPTYTYPSATTSTYSYSTPSYSYGSASSAPQYEPWQDPSWNPRQETRGVLRDFHNSDLTPRERMWFH